MDIHHEIISRCSKVCTWHLGGKCRYRISHVEGTTLPAIKGFSGAICDLCGKCPYRISHVEDTTLQVLKGFLGAFRDL